MASKRKHSRVALDFSITCTFRDTNNNKVLTSPGKVYDISLGGMRVSVPIPRPMISSSTLDYKINLPEPFDSLTGNGKIKWSDRDDKNGLIMFGMAFSELREDQKQVIESIVEELNEG